MGRTGRGRYPLPPMPTGNTAHPGNATRRTLEIAARPIEGLGLFTGAPTRVTMRPIGDAGVGASGILFRRTDLGGTPTVQATIGNVVSEQRRTVLQARGPDGALLPVRVETVEHILSALAGLGVTDALIDIDGPEIPIGDGSALAFAEAVRAAGVVPASGTSAGPLRITRPLTVGEKGAQVEILPADEHSSQAVEGCEYVYRLDYGPASPIAAHDASFFVPTGGDATTYIPHLAPARTFSTLDEAKALRQMGLFTQFTPRDLLVIGPDGPVDNTLRFSDEPARHKVLDMVGDLSLCGRPIIGRIIATRSGHALNHEAARSLAALV